MTDDGPQNRRFSDIPSTDTQLILYQLGELKVAVSELRSEVRDGFKSHDYRIAALETFRTRVEAREKAEADSGAQINSRWIPIVLGILAFVGVILSIVLTNH